MLSSIFSSNFFYAPHIFSQDTASFMCHFYILQVTLNSGESIVVTPSTNVLEYAGEQSRVSISAGLKRMALKKKQKNGANKSTRRKKTSQAVLETLDIQSEE